MFNRYALIFLSYTLIAGAGLCANQENSPENRGAQILQKMREDIGNLVNRINQEKERLKEKWNETIDDLTQQSAQEIKNDILAQVKLATCYNAATTHPENNPSSQTRAYVAWYVLKGYELPKDAVYAYYTHCIKGQKKFRVWKRGVTLANQELNAERAK